jgi:hypothetical protein
MEAKENEQLATHDEETALRLIEALLALRGLSRKDLDRRIGRTPGYVTQIINGTIGLKFSMLVRMICALEFEPEVFFRTVFKRSRPLVFGADPASLEQVLERLRELDIEPPPARSLPSAEAIDMDALEAMIQRAVADALARRAPAGSGAAERPAAPKSSARS